MVAFSSLKAFFCLPLDSYTISPLEGSSGYWAQVYRGFPSVKRVIISFVFIFPLANMSNPMCACKLVLSTGFQSSWNTQLPLQVGHVHYTPLSHWAGESPFSPFDQSKQHQTLFEFVPVHMRASGLKWATTSCLYTTSTQTFNNTVCPHLAVRFMTLNEEKLFNFMVKKKG